MRKLCKHSEEGFGLIEAMGVLLVIALLVPGLAALWQKGVTDLRKRSVADHFTLVLKASEKYAKLNHASLLTQSTKTSGARITLDQLKTSNCLQTSISPTNAWNQSYDIQTRLNSNNELVVVVLTTGGRKDTVKAPAFANIIVPETAAMARAGFIPSGLLASKGIIKGPHGNWEISLATMGLTAEPGHLGIVSTFDSQELAHDFLYRVEVPGHEELNAMQTTLDMTGHDINHVGSIGFDHQEFDMSFCTGAEDEGRTFLDKDTGLYLCRDGKVVLLNDTGNSLMVQEKTLGWDGMLVDKPTCPEGAGLIPEIFVAQTIFSSGAQSPPIVSSQAWATNYSQEQWQLHLRIKTTSDEWIHPTANYGRVEVTTTCARE